MESVDYKSLLFDYFTKFDNTSEGYLNVLTSVRYLTRTNMSSAPSATISAILEKMIRAAEVISHYQRRRSVHGCENAEDEVWMKLLYYERGRLSDTYAPLFRQLLHIFEGSHTHSVLIGDQGDIKRWLHESLEAVHEGQICEVAECSWVYHQCPWTWGSYYTDCPLITGTNMALEPAYLLPDRHADDDETSAPAPPTEPSAQRLCRRTPVPPAPSSRSLPSSRVVHYALCL